MLAADEVALDQDLLVQRGQTVHRLGERVLHFRQSFDRRPDQLQHPNPLRLFGPARESRILEVARQPDAAGHHDPVVRPFAARAFGRRNKKAVNVHDVQAAAVLAEPGRRLLDLVPQDARPASKSSSSMALSSFFCSVFSRSDRSRLWRSDFGNFAHVPRAFVHGLEQALQRFGKGLVTLRAAQPARLLEIRLGETAARAFHSAPPPACSISCDAPSPSSRSASEKPVGSLTPLVLAHPRTDPPSASCPRRSGSDARWLPFPCRCSTT